MVIVESLQPIMMELGSLDSSRKVTLIPKKFLQIDFMHSSFSVKVFVVASKPPGLSAKQRLHYTLVRSVSDAAAHFIFTPAVTSLVRHDHRDPLQAASHVDMAFPGRKWNR